MYDNMAPWIDKLVEELANGNATEAITLTSDAQDAPWFKKTQAHASAICFTTDRVAFHASETGRTSKSSRIRNAFAYFGPNPEKFAAVFAEIGGIWKPTPTSDH
jgi:hypothetical protein